MGSPYATVDSVLAYERAIWKSDTLLHPPDPSIGGTVPHRVQPLNGMSYQYNSPHSSWPSDPLALSQFSWSVDEPVQDLGQWPSHSQLYPSTTRNLAGNMLPGSHHSPDRSQGHVPQTQARNSVGYDWTGDGSDSPMTENMSFADYDLYPTDMGPAHNQHLDHSQYADAMTYNNSKSIKNKQKDVGTIQCDYIGCTATFTTRQRVSQHKRFHTKRYRCAEDDCGVAFSTKKDLARHENTKHQKAVLPKCKYCDKRMRLDNLRRHEQQLHTQVKSRNG